MEYVASILAPFVVYLDVVSSILPLVLGTLGIICSLLTLFLPETLNKDLPQTLQDGEDFEIRKCGTLLVSKGKIMTREENFNLLIYLYEIHKKFLTFLLNVNNFIIFNYLKY